MYVFTHFLILLLLFVRTMYRHVYRTLPMRGLMSLNDSKELETWNFMDIYTIELKPQPHFQASRLIHTSTTIVFFITLDRV